MEDDGGEMLVSSVDQEIKESLRRAVTYLEEACNTKAQKVNIRRMRNSNLLWLAYMATEANKDISYELTNRTGRANLLWEFLKKFTFTSNHTLVALVSAAGDRFAIKYGSESQNKLKAKGRELQQEFMVIVHLR